MSWYIGSGTLRGWCHQKNVRLSVTGDSNSGDLAAIIDAAGGQGLPPGSLRNKRIEVDYFPLAIEKAARATSPDDLPSPVDGKSRALLAL